jgi:transcriptional regulator with XRE-family HTH domain
MEQAEMTQTALASKAGVSQKTISNYLNPDQRAESATGKMPSPKLEELDKIARALAIPVWQLVREMSEKERKLYEHIERAYSELVSDSDKIPSRPAQDKAIGDFLRENTPKSAPKKKLRSQ